MMKVPLNVQCPSCKHSLMDSDKMIDGYSSVRVVIQYGDKRGTLFLSSVYDSHNNVSEIDVPLDEKVLFFCPLCNSDLLTTTRCDKCNAPMASFELSQGGKLKICSRRGCKQHFIKFADLAKEISVLYDVYDVYSAHSPLLLPKKSIP